MRLLLVLVLLLAGCSSAAQRNSRSSAPALGGVPKVASMPSAEQKLAEIAGVMKATFVWQKSCEQEVAERPELKPIKNRLPLQLASSATLEQMSSAAHATPREIAALSQWRQMQDACFREAINNMAGTAPGLLQPLRTMAERRDDAIVALSRKRMTWGDAVTELRNAKRDVVQQIDANSSRISEALHLQAEEAREREELARLEARAAALERELERSQRNTWSPPARVQTPSIQMPRRTACHQIGMQLECTTW